MPDATHATLALAELVIELDQVKAELDRERTEVKRWRTIAYGLAAALRDAGVRSVSIGEVVVQDPVG